MFCIIILFDTYILLYPVPSAPPTDVLISDKISSTITMRWRPVKCIHRNGDVTGYSVRYRIQGNGSIQTVNVRGENSTDKSISGLKSSTTYSIEVAAVNSAGIGMYSNPLNVTTSVAGNFFQLKRIKYIQCILCISILIILHINFYYCYITFNFVYECYLLIIIINFSLLSFFLLFLSE